MAAPAAALVLSTQLRITKHSALNRPVDDWGKLLDDTAAVSALLDRLLHHAHVLKGGPRSWRTKVQTDLRTEEATKENPTGLGCRPEIAGFARRRNGRFCPSTEGRPAQAA